MYRKETYANRNRINGCKLNKCISKKKYLILLSLLDKNLPRILIASTRKPLLSSMLMMVSTHS